MAVENRQVFLLPDLGEGLTEAELVNWLVAVGDEVRVDQPIAEVETAKSMVEVPSPYAGIVAELHGAAGTTMDVGKPLISVDRAGISVESAAAATYLEEERAGAQPPVEPIGAGPTGAAAVAASPAAAAPAAAAPAAAAPAAAASPAAKEPAESKGSGNVLIGYGTSDTGATGRRRPRKNRGGAALTAAAEMQTAAAAVDNPSRTVQVVSPLVRKLARDGGVRLGELTGSGPDGLILRRDVETAMAGGNSVENTSPAGDANRAGDDAPTPEDRRSAPASGAPAAGSGAFARDEKTGLGVVARTPLKGLRKVVAANLSRSRREIPEATVWVDVDATALLQLRAELKKRNPDTVPGLLAFIARFVLAGLAKYPELNTRVEDPDDGQEIVSFDGVNLGFAAQTDRGLMVPSVRNAEKMSARELDAEIRRLTAVARSGKASPDELTSGTFTLNNYGVFGVDGSAAIINHPEVAILGVGRIIDKPWVVDGVLAVRKVTELTLTFDHRVCDGGVAGGFLRYVADAIESPGGVLADL